MPVLDVEKLIEERVAAIKAYHAGAGLPRAQLDVSGGVDSAVMLGLLAKALGPENVCAVYSNIMSSGASMKQAFEVAKAFNVKLLTVDLIDIYREIQRLSFAAISRADLGEKHVDIAVDRTNDPTVDGSLRSTLRAPVGRYFNRLMGGIRHGTGNECEDRWIRFYNKGGDGEVDTNPLGFLSKGEVFQLAVGLGVPRSIVEAKPAPDLWANGEGHTDEDELSSYIGFQLPEGMSWYSYVDYDSGQYKNVGLIERVNRFMDEEGVWPDDLEHVTISGSTLACFTLAHFKPLFAAVARIDAATRHKENPTIPMFSSRDALLDAKILTNDLPTTEEANDEVG